MSSFEFILVLIAIVAGFAISEILYAWGRLIRARVSPRRSALYAGASLLLLGYIVRYVWDLWVFRHAEWHFATFLLIFAPILVLSLAAHVISVPREPGPDLLEHYLLEAGPFYVLMAVFLVLWTLSDASNSWHALATAVGSADRVPRIVVGRALMAAVFLVLAYTRNPTLHALLVPLAIGGLVAGSAMFLPRL